MTEGKRVYIAAPWTEKVAAAKLGEQMEDLGFEVTEKWWLHDDVDMKDPANFDELEQQANMDITGVLNADLFVLLNTSKSEGKAVETGIALMCVLPIVVIGERSNLFHYLSDVAVVPTVEEFINVIRG